MEKKIVCVRKFAHCTDSELTYHSEPLEVKHLFNE